MKRKRLASVLGSVFLLGGLLSSSCGGGEAKESGSSTGGSAPSAGRQSKPELPKQEEPEFDAEARYDGKTLSEYAAGLEDLNAAVRKRAMESILRFGVNAYPLKERMRKLAVEDPEDELRAAAFVALYRMEDPEATEFLLERMRDPAAFQEDRGWQMFLQVAVEEVDAELLSYEAAELVDASTEHGEHLLRVSGSGVPRAGAFRNALGQALIAKEHSDATVSTLFGMLHGLDLSPKERVAYVVDHHGRLSSPDLALNTLSHIGTQEAFEALLEILEGADPPLQTRLATITGFPETEVTGGRKLEVLAGYLPAETEADVQQVFASMQNVANRSDDAQASARFQELLTDLAGDAEQDSGVHALALLYLCDGVAVGKMSAAALDPVFVALEADPEEIVLGTALQELKKLVPRASDEVLASLPERIAETMYARDPADDWSHAVAQGMLETLTAGLGRLDVDASVSALSAKVAAQPGHPVNFQLFQWLLQQSSSLKRLEANMPAAAALAGTLLVDGSMGQAQADWLYNSGNMTFFDNVTRADVETIIAFYEPVMTAERLPEHRYFTRIRQTAMQSMYHLRGNEPDLAKYVAFAQRMANEAPPASRVAALLGINSNVFVSHQPAHAKGIAHFDHDLVGKPARIKPTLLGNGRPLPAGSFDTGDEGEVFLMTRNTQMDPTSLGNVAGLEVVHAIAFLDDQGNVIGLGRTDDPELIQENGRVRTLTHPSAHHALLYVDGSFPLEAGSETGLDPEFLRLL